MRLYNTIVSITMVFSLLLITLGIRPAHATEEELEYKLKAAFMLNFAKFTTWPESSITTQEEFFNFCVMGADPFKAAIKGVEAKQVGGKPIRLQYVHGTEEAQQCHVLFISQSEQTRVQQIIKDLEAASILTVSDIEGFARMGGMFEFIKLKERLSFIVNNRQIKKSGLQVSASLLNLAAEVY